MNISSILKTGLMAALALAAVNVNADNIDVNQARDIAGKFVQQNKNAMFKAPSASAIQLAHTQASNVKGNAYYVFNIDGGGWVVIAGDDIAKEVLAYGTEGSLDMNAMPENMKGFLNMLKGQIETAQAYKGKTVPVKAIKLSAAVGPLLKTRWGQGEPWNRQCPTNASGQRTSVGCAPLAMAQIVNYWKYPNEVPELSGYQGTGYQWYSSLPATTFDYDLIVDAYRYYDPETGNPIIADYTDEQANEVAKLSRYCGQACKSRYGNDGTSTGSYSYDQRTAFKTFGYNENLQLIGKDPSYYNDNSNKYTIEEWTALMRTELEAGRPIPYHDMWEGHAWVVDGVDVDGKFHMNWGFNGKFDGWFEINALVFNPYDDDEVWDFSQSSNSGNEMIINCFPYEGYVIPGSGDETIPGDINGDNKVNISDVMLLINYLSNGSSADINLDAADYNGEGGITISDAIDMVNHILSSAE